MGHSHPYVLQKAKEQLDLLQHTTTIYYHPTIAAYGKMLADKMPGDLSVCYFVNSGSEANDTVLRMVRHYWAIKGQPEKKVVIGRWNGYHGSTIAGASQLAASMASACG